MQYSHPDGYHPGVSFSENKKVKEYVFSYSNVVIESYLSFLMKKERCVLKRNGEQIA